MVGLVALCVFSRALLCASIDELLQSGDEGIGVVLGEVLCIFDDLYGFLLSVLDGNEWHLERSKTNESGATLDEEWR